MLNFSNIVSGRTYQKLHRTITEKSDLHKAFLLVKSYSVISYQFLFDCMSFFSSPLRNEKIRSAGHTTDFLYLRDSVFIME